MKELCFDISTWQGGINYNSIKSKAKYCILRAGFSETEDNQFQNHYNNLQGLNLGAYWYSYATTIDEAKKEARRFLQVIGDRKFTLPLFLDLEDSSQAGLGRNTLNNIVKAFGDIIENAGYYFAVYTNLNWYRNIISGSELNKKYDWWIACWSDNPPSGVDYGVWQFTSDYNIDGNRVDANYIFKDYPTIIKNSGLNHLGNSNFRYRAHIQGPGWQEWKDLGEIAGTTGEFRRLEGIQIDAPKYDIYAKAHCQGDNGWRDYGKITKSTIIGTEKQAKRLEAIQLKLPNNIKWRVHMQGTGWSCWTKGDGVITLGSMGLSQRIEAIQFDEVK